jgi:hypothetical protein
VSNVTKTVIEEFDAEGNLVKRTTTTVESKPTTKGAWGDAWQYPNTLPAYPTDGIRMWS